MRKVKVFIINGFILTACSLLMRTITMGFMVYISNKIGTETLGVYQLIMSVYMFFITLATSGINLASTRIISEELVSNNILGAKKAAKQCILFSLCMGVLAGIILFFASPYISKNWIHGKISYTSIRILSIALPFMSISSAINGYFLALRKSIQNASSQVFGQFLKIFATTYLFTVFLPDTIEFACISLVLGSTIAELLSCIYSYILYKLHTRKLNSTYRKQSDYRLRIFKISMPVAATSYIRSGLSTLKQVLIPVRLERSGISCEQALSQYGIINGMVIPILMFPSILINTFSELLIPEFSDYNYTKSYIQINYVINRVLKIAFIFSIFIIGIFWFFSNEISSLLYNNPDVPFFLKALSPIVVLIYVDNIIDALLKGLNKQVGVMLINILDLFVTISFIYFLLPVHGVYGYIIILFISELLNFIISIGILIKTTKFKIDFKTWFVKPTLAVIFSCFSLSLFDLSRYGFMFKFIVEIIFFITCYFSFLILTSCIGKKDFNFLKN